MSSSTAEAGPCGEEDLAGDDCHVKLISTSNEFVYPTRSSFTLPSIPLSPLWSSLLYFELPAVDHSLPVWLYACISSPNDDRLDSLVTLLHWNPPPSTSNQTAEQQQREAGVIMSEYNVSSSIDYLRPLSTQRSGASDSILVTSLDDAGYYGVLLTNTNTSSEHNFTVNLSYFSSRPVVSLNSPFSVAFPVNSIGLFFLFLLLSSLCLGCLVLGRRYCASFRRKGGKKYHGVSKLPEGDGRGVEVNGGAGLDGRAEGGDSMEAWDAEMKEMDSLELQLSDEGEQSEFELNEIATIYRQPQPPQLQPQPPQLHAQHHPTADGKRSPAREESKTNGNGAAVERVSGSPVRLSSVVVEGTSRQSPPPIAPPMVQPISETQQRVQPTTTSGKKKKKKKRDENGELSEA